LSQNKKVIAITGGIGSGKSAVCEILSDWGYPVINCDVLGKEVSAYPSVLKKISREFGKSFVIDGKLDRRKLAEYVFKEQSRTDKLNEIFHSEIGELLSKKLSAHDSLVFVEVSVPKSLPKGIVDETWEVRADPETRKKRIMFRDNIRIDQIQDIMSRQTYSLDADIVIDNNGYIEDLKLKIKDILSAMGENNIPNETKENEKAE